MAQGIPQQAELPSSVLHPDHCHLSGCQLAAAVFACRIGLRNREAASAASSNVFQPSASSLAILPSAAGTWGRPFRAPVDANALPAPGGTLPQSSISRRLVSQETRDQAGCAPAPLLCPPQKRLPVGETFPEGLANRFADVLFRKAGRCDVSDGAGNRSDRQALAIRDLRGID